MKTTYAKIAAIVLGLLIIMYLFIQPSNERDWTTDQQVLAYGIVEGDTVQLFNVRNFTYQSTQNYTPQYYNKTVHLSELDSLFYIVEPFDNWKGPAHTFLSFGFQDDYVAISVEIRKEKGEEFSPFKGLLKQYEIMYVIGDERDLIKLRTNYRNDDVYVYPVITTKANMKKVFVDMVVRANELRESPEFYNTITNTCTTNLVAHTNVITPGKVPLSYKVLLPGYSDELAYDIGLIPTDEPFADIQQKYHINIRAKQFANDPNFSQKIREAVQ